MKLHLPKPKVGDIMVVAHSPVVTASLTTSIYDIVHIMAREGFRRIPIVDPGTGKLQGIVTSTDIVDYFGGGEKFHIVQQKFGGAFFKAINEPVKSILTANPPFVPRTATIADAIRLMKERKVGGLPIVNDSSQVEAIITERDLLRIFKAKIALGIVSDLMTSSVITAPAEISILNAEKMMVEKSFRRLPLLDGEHVVGLVTAMDIVRFFGSGDVFSHLRSGTILQVLETPVIDVGVKQLVTTEPSTDLAEAAEVMTTQNIGSLLVIDEGKLKGILTERDFLKLVKEW
jgi:CBS domain-containing protein